MTQSDDFIGQRQRRLENLQKLKEQGVNPYPADSKKEFSNKEVVEKYQEFEGKK
jgi:lysyl-tRNA synthetase class II